MTKALTTRSLSPPVASRVAVDPRPLRLTYVLPIRRDAIDGPGDDSEDLDSYLRRLAQVVDEVVVVDGSPTDVFTHHRRRWGRHVRHVAPQAAPHGRPDKPAGVVTGARLAGHDVLVVADDDVRWTKDQLRDALDRMDGVDLLRPHNHFAPEPWHARWDTGRILVNRAMGGDWPGTLVVRRDLVTPGYGHGVLFENLDLERTVVARGGRARVAYDLVVARRPPTSAWFARQRVRQAYDEFARPVRLAWQLAVLPLALAGGRRARLGLAVAAIAVAEAGRRRGGTGPFRPTAPLWAPLWLAERSVCSWAALVARCRGGVTYRGHRVKRAGTPARDLR